MKDNTAKSQKPVEDLPYYNQVNSLSWKIEQLEAKIKEQNSELLMLYRELRKTGDLE